MAVEHLGAKGNTLVCAKASPLFEQDVVVLIESHFANVLAQISERDQAQDRVSDDDSQESY